MNQLQTFIAGLPFGFLTAEQMPELIKLDRLHPCLVRCGGCRFTCAAQYVSHLIKCVEAGGDYVRDVSLPVGSAERAAGCVQEETMAKVLHQAKNNREAHHYSENLTFAPCSGSPGQWAGVKPHNMNQTKLE